MFSQEEIWGYSSAGRAPALQAGGLRFDPAYLHQFGEFEIFGSRATTKVSTSTKKFQLHPNLNFGELEFLALA